ncbi:MAG: hypothetical protein U9R20_05095 [Thermodesulfobacteriota bacterium]|nr:hypothetical protein [Thermodesulfobacteriota bacterium]
MTSYDFRSLSPIDFEGLVRDLLQEELALTLESFKPGKDLGIDFRFTIDKDNTLGGCPRIQKVIFLPQYIVRQDIVGHNIMWSEFSNLYCRTAS